MSILCVPTSLGPKGARIRTGCPALAGYSQLQAEVKYGTEKSRIDFCSKQRLGATAILRSKPSLFYMKARVIFRMR